MQLERVLGFPMAARDRNVGRTIDITPTLDHGLSTADIPTEFEKVCTSFREELSTEDVRAILEANGQDSSGSHAALLQRCQGLVFYGSLNKCPVCKNGNMEYTESYYCVCATCPFNTMYPPRKREPIKFPVRVLKAINPDYVDPPVGFYDYPPLQVMKMKLTIYEDGVEINGWRLNKIFSNPIVRIVLVALIGFTLLNFWSKMSR